MTNITPTNPIITAIHLLGPTFSFKNKKAKIVTKNGLVISSVYTSATGNKIRPVKKQIAVKTS